VTLDMLAPARPSAALNKPRDNLGSRQDRKVKLKVESWDPDLQSLHARYLHGDLDLQPSFQRGLVWNPEKKARLVDTLIRGWRMPPVHYLVEPDERLSILDGQQRLSAVFEFLEDAFPLRFFPPNDQDLSALYGSTFSHLPERYQRRILSSRIAGYRLDEYTPEEPFELFFRLNLPTGLTQAEKRNALVGPAREQVRQLVGGAVKLGWSKELLGFGDGRMSYDDIVARLCMYLDANDTGAPLTPRDLEVAYRSGNGFAPDVVNWARASIEYFTWSISRIDKRLRMNKATLLTWLLVSARAEAVSTSSLSISGALESLELARMEIGRRAIEEVLPHLPNPIAFAPLASLYTNRASLRVADVLSVQTRDAIAWLVIAEDQPAAYLPEMALEVKQAAGKTAYLGFEGAERALLELVSDTPRWGLLR
jgi:hypothetical protein